jgi:hypothetical protein
VVVRPAYSSGAAGRVEDRVQGSGLRVQDEERVQGSGFRVQERPFLSRILEPRTLNPEP